MRRALTSTTIAAALALLAACGEAPPESRYIGESPEATSAPEAPKTTTDRPVTITAAGLTMRPAGAWRATEPSSGMRKAQFEVGPAETAAEVIVFHFGPGQGGSVEDNLLRWARQVLDESGEPTLPEIVEFDSNGLHVTLASFSGTYLAGPPGGATTEMPNWTLLAAVIEGGPQGTVFPRLVGPSAVVSEQRDAFEQFLRSAAPAQP